MLSKTGFIYVLWLLILTYICSIFGLFTKYSTFDTSSRLIFLFSLFLIISVPNFILMFSDRIFNSVLKGDIDKITSFINKGVNVNKKNSYGKTLLHYAILSRNEEILILLIRNQADIDIKDNEGNTPLHLAVSYGYFDVVKLLLENGARVSIRNKKNQTPLKMLQENYFSTFPQETKNNIINLLKGYESS